MVDAEDDRSSTSDVDMPSATTADTEAEGDKEAEADVANAEEEANETMIDEADTDCITAYCCVKNEFFVPAGHVYVGAISLLFSLTQGLVACGWRWGNT